MNRLLFLLVMFALPAWGDSTPLPITPKTAGTKTISCTSTTGATALSVSTFTQVELQNVGANTIFVEFGDSTATAVVATGYPVLAGQSKVVTISPFATHIACITASVTTTLYATVGQGN